LTGFQKQKDIPMRKASFGLIPALFAFAAFFYLPAVEAYAQAPTRDTFVISARAGGVNAVTGGARVRTHGNTEWQQLTIKEDLGVGDLVKTGFDGRVEMLLNPGSYLRVGENSEFEFINNSLDNLEVRLLKGTAIVEATGADDTEMQINITTPHTRLAIVRRGLYRLNVIPGDNTELIVRKGRVMLDRSQTKITGGNKVVFSNDTFLIAKLQKAEKKSFDQLDQWSKERADTVAQANRKIKSRELGMLMSSLRNGWFDASSRGLWWYNARYSCYTFVPFFMGWGSPYGNYYSNAFFPGYCCSGRGVYYPGYGNVAGSGTLGTSTGSGSGSGSGSGNSRPRDVIPSLSGSGPSRPPAMEGRILRHQDRPNQ
jgi:hypothetical protein